jgi:hypothetical protein
MLIENRRRSMTHVFFSFLMVEELRATPSTLVEKRQRGVTLTIKFNLNSTDWVGFFCKWVQLRS